MDKDYREQPKAVRSSEVTPPEWPRISGMNVPAAADDDMGPEWDDEDRYLSTYGEGTRSGSRSRIGDRDTSGSRSRTGDRDTSGSRSRIGDRDTSGSRSRTGDRDTSGSRSRIGDRDTSGSRSRTGDRNTAESTSRTGRSSKASQPGKAAALLGAVRSGAGAIGSKLSGAVAGDKRNGGAEESEQRAGSGSGTGGNLRAGSDVSTGSRLRSGKSSSTEGNRSSRSRTPEPGSRHRTARETASGRTGTSRRSASGKKADPRTKQIRKYVRLSLFFAAFLYDELLLKLFCGKPGFSLVCLILMIAAAALFAVTLMREPFSEEWNERIRTFGLPAIAVIFVIGCFAGGSGYPFLFALGFALICTAASMPFSKKVNKIIILVILAVTGAVFATESIIKNVFPKYMSISMLLSGAGNVATKYGGQMWSAIFFGIPKIVLFLVPWILYFVFGDRHAPAKRFRYQFALVLLGAGVLLTLFTSLAASGISYYSKTYDFDAATQTFGLITATRLSAKYDLFGNSRASFNSENVLRDEADTADAGATEQEAESAAESAAEEPVATAVKQRTAPEGKNEMNLNFAALEASDNAEVRSLTEYIESQSASSKNIYTGLFEGKNLILISAESYCSAFIDPELTPTLWRLTHNGIYFSEYYQPEWGGSTTTGELSWLVGLAPNKGDDSMIAIKDNNLYFTLPNALQRAGYSTGGFHNGSVEYYSRSETHTNLGLNQFIANENGIGDLVGYHYPYDQTLFESTMWLFEDKEPFCTYYMTLYGHAPYTSDNALVEKYYDFVDSIVGDKYEQRTKEYICYQMGLEDALTYMLEELERKDLLDDTVIAMVGDHYPYGLGKGEAWGNDKNYLDDLLKADHTVQYNEDRNGLVIWCGSLENEDSDMAIEVSDPVFSLDIVPTLLNMFGIEFDSRLLPGRDVMAPDTEPLCFWYNVSWVTRRGKYDAFEEVYTPREGYTQDPEYVETIKGIVENKLLMSHKIMELDYYGLLFGEDEVTRSGELFYNGETETDVATHLAREEAAAAREAAGTETGNGTESTGTGGDEAAGTTEASGTSETDGTTGTAETSGTEGEEVIGTGRINADGVNFRKEPFAGDDNVIRSVSTDDTVEILKYSGSWVKVRIGDEVGYVSEEFITED